MPLNEWFGSNHWYQWFSNGFWSINHWSRWFFSLATIGLDGFAMVFGLATIGLDGFSMVANHWSNDGMVTIHRYGLVVSEPVSEKFGTGKSLGTGIGKIWYRKKYRYRYRKYLVPEKSIGIGIVQHFGYRHTLSHMMVVVIAYII